MAGGNVVLSNSINIKPILSKPNFKFHKNQ